MKKSIQLLLVVLLFLASLPAGAFEFTTTFPAPEGTTPVIDGERSAGEWDDAVRVELLGGGEMFLKHDEDYLYILIEAKRKGIASLCVERPQGISVLHASAALGTAEYKGHFKNTEAIRSFMFELRDTGNSMEARKARKHHLSDEKWFANTSRRGSTTREFQISLDIAAERGRIPMAVTFFMYDEGLVAYWPEDLSDGCLNLQLIKGTAPDQLNFEPHRWPVVTIEKLKPPAGDK